MKSKQFIALLMAAVVSPSSILIAQDQIISMGTEVNLEVDTTQTNEMTHEYLSKTGEITEINKEEERYRLLVGTPLDGVQYILDNSEIIIDAETLNFLQPSDLKIGMELTVVVPKNAPMTLSLPPMMSDQTVIIVNSPETCVNMSYFDEMLVNKENTLALNITKDTYITNTKGEKRIFTADDIKNNSSVVIYTFATKSIPAQTNPKMVLILPNSETVSNEEETKSTPSVEGTGDLIVRNVEDKSVGVRDLATTHGYDVKWDNETKSVTLTKAENTIIVTVGKAEVMKNGEACTLQAAATIENQKVYVSSELEELL